MKLKKIIIFSLILFIGLTFISTASSQDISDLNLTNDINENDNAVVSEKDNEILANEACCEDENESNTWYVEPDPENPNQVQKPTVQPVIDNAKPGDTIILNGTFVHCHFMINKTLTIIATSGTSVGVCPHHTHMMKYGTGPESNGIFYISPEANGTTINGFSFTNDFYYIANNQYNPFGVFIDADDVVLENLTFNWVGIKNNVSKYDPDDFLFNAIILNNTRNISINNISLGNVKSFITSINASNINTNNVSIVKPEINQKDNTNIAISNLNLLVGDEGYLQITLKDADNNVISGKTLNIIVDGVSKILTTDNQGIVKLSVKYDSAGTHFVTASFLGDDAYGSSIQSSKIIITKKSTKLTVQKATLKVKKAKKIFISLKSNGKTISGKKIIIKVNGKTFSAKTNSKGVASIKVKVNKKGTFKYTAKFAGDNAYKSISKTGKIKVKK